MRALDAMNRLAALLREGGVEDSAKEAEAIVVHATGIGRVALFRDNPVIDTGRWEMIESLGRRRMAGEPLEYIIGRVEFLGLKVVVGPGVLIPRPETELLVEEALRSERVRKADKDGDALMVLDLCTGSGCIALSVASRLPSASVYGVDISEEALGYARENARINGIKNVHFLRGDLYRPVGGMGFDLIVSNPPYIRSGDISRLQREVRDWEPRSALDGGPDGLRYYRGILGGLRAHLRHGGECFLEVGFDQREAVGEIARSNGLTVEFRKDLAGCDRVCRVIIGKPSCPRPGAWPRACG